MYDKWEFEYEFIKNLGITHYDQVRYYDEWI